MRKPSKPAKQKLDYPDETEGSRLAAQARALASRHTPEERRAHLDAAMAMIYGGTPDPATTVARRKPRS
jgi:hypothetical protein